MELVTRTQAQRETRRTLGSVVLANVTCGVLALSLDWSLSELLWIYWWQNIVIGAVNYRRMRGLKSFSTEGFTSNGKRVPETEEGKRSTANFFAFHYGGFHLGYLMFLFSEHSPAELTAISSMFLFVAIITFTYSHFWSFERNRTTEFAGKKPNLGTLMFYPYLRILPMHLLIVAGHLLGGSQLAGFIVLKTLADVGMQAVEDRLFLKQPKP